MPKETPEAVAHAKNQIDSYTDQQLLDEVRKFFNDNDIECPPMEFSDLKPYL